MGRMRDKVVLITGAARGQGRAHAVRLAEEGADIIALDLCAQASTVTYPMSTKQDLDETAGLVEGLGRRVVARVADVRDQAALDAAVRDGVAELGRLDGLALNAGIAEVGRETWEFSDEQWQETIDINLTGVWRSAKAAVPTMIACGNGGSIAITSSYAGLNGVRNSAAYVSSKHGVVGLMRTMANELGDHRIRVNTIHPGNVDTPMLFNDALYRLFRPELENPGREDAVEVMHAMSLLPTPYLDAVDISNALLFLLSDESRYITGVELPVDAGWNVTS